MTKNQKETLIKYIKNDQPASIYGKDGIYQELEERFCKIYDSKHCILTNTGTSALSSAYSTLNLKPKDEVIVPIYTFPATITPLLRLNCKLVFADAHPQIGLITPEAITEHITPCTKAVVVTHMWGLPCKMEEITKICKNASLSLIEDVSHAHITPYKGKMLGTWGDVGAMSLGAQKIVSGGEGGMLITDNDIAYIRATFLGHFKKRASESLQDVSSRVATVFKGFESGFGENYRMHPYSAVMINALLKDEIDSIINKRVTTLKQLSKKLKKIDGIQPQKVVQGAMYGYKPKILDNADSVVKKMQKQGYEIKHLDTIPLDTDRVFQKWTLHEEYPGAREYINGRVSIRNKAISKFIKNPSYMDEYLTILKKCLK